MSTEKLTTLKLRIPEERYIALLHLAHTEERSANYLVNEAISRMLSESLPKIKESVRGQSGGNSEEGEE